MAPFYTSVTTLFYDYPGKRLLSAYKI